MAWTSLPLVYCCSHVDFPPFPQSSLTQPWVLHSQSNSKWVQEMESPAQLQTRPLGDPQVLGHGLENPYILLVKAVPKKSFPETPQELYPQGTKSPVARFMELHPQSVPKVCFSSPFLHPLNGISSYIAISIIFTFLPLLMLKFPAPRFSNVFYVVQLYKNSMRERLIYQRNERNPR